MSAPSLERLTLTPSTPRHRTPLLFLHGMWHGAWCWAQWQEWFAGWGWESVAFSLPGHGGSPPGRPIRWRTLGYYLRTLRAEVERLPRPPVLVGHSMGGALAQWLLKYVRDDLPAAVLVAPWTSHNMLPAVLRFLTFDPAGFLLSLLTLTTTPTIRTPERAARMFLTPGASLSPEQLHASLGPESLWVLLQYNPLLWRPLARARTPLLWLAAQDDSLITEAEQRRSAAHYGARYLTFPGGHDLTLEHSSRLAAEAVRDWLEGQGIA